MYYKTNKNIIFFISVFIIILIVSFLNHIVGPYNYYDNHVFIGEDNSEFINILLKKDKMNKYDDMILGSSDTASMFSYHIFNKKIITVGCISIKNYYEILKAYTDIHPETKHIILVISMQPIIHKTNLDLPEYTGINYNKEEIIKLHFSLFTTVKSFERLINCLKDHSSILSFFNHAKSNDYTNIIYTNTTIKDFCTYPNRIYNHTSTYEELREREKKNFYYTKQIIKLLKEKNIKFEFVISPANSILLAVIYKNELFRETVANYKKFLANQNVKVYDMAFPNKYTNTDLRDKNQLLYMDYLHPSFLYGEKLYKLFFDKKLDKKDFYFILNKNNVEAVINKEDNLIKKYIQDNKEIINYYQNNNLDTDYKFCRDVEYQYNKYD